MQIDLEKEGSRARYLKASLTLFADKGYHLVSVRDIAKEAGTSEAALYRHFESKEQMALYLFRLILKAYIDKVKEIAEDEDRSTVERLCELQRFTYDFYAKDTQSVQFALLSQYQFWGEVEEELRPHYWMRALIEEGVKKGEIVQQPIYLTLSLYTGLILEPLIQYQYFKEAHDNWESFKEGVAFNIRKLLVSDR